MLYTEKEMKETLGKEIQISETVEKRLRDTYGQIKSTEKMSGKRRGIHFGRGAAAAAAVLLLSGTTAMAAYLASNTDLINHVFGQGGRQSKESYEKTFDNGKGGDVTATMPAKEYVEVEEEAAENLVEPYTEELNIVRQIGDYKLTFISNVTDGNGGCVSYKLECEGGICAMEASEEKNETKGVFFTEDRDFYFCLNDADGNPVGEKTVIDMEKSTDTCYYLYSSYVCNDVTDSMILHLEQYDRPVSEAEDQWNCIMEEDIPIVSKQMPLTVVVNPENGERQYAYSAMSLSLNLSNGFGLDEYVDTDSGSKFVDPYYVKYIAVVYKDGTTYVVQDDTNAVDNTNYICGGMGENCDAMNLVFNRMVDWSKAEKLVVNEVEFPVSQK